MDDFNVALWVEDFSYPLEDLSDWVDLVRSKAREAKEKAAHVLLLPEYACLHWIAFADNLPGNEHLEWLDSMREEALAAIMDIAKEMEIVIIPGTFPVQVPQPFPMPLCKQSNDEREDMEEGRFYNRAYVIDETGIIATQDKLVLTPWELDEQNWNIHPGSAINTFTINGVDCAILICLDVEQARLAQEVYKKDVDVLFVPSMTLLPSGHARVRNCARARAVEGIMAVATVGAVGVPSSMMGKETNYSGAAVFGPCEMDMVQNGIFEEVPASYGMSVVSPGVLKVTSIPVNRLWQKRAGQPEAWPGIITLNKIES